MQWKNTAKYCGAIRKAKPLCKIRWKCIFWAQKWFSGWEAFSVISLHFLSSHHQRCNHHYYYSLIKSLSLFLSLISTCSRNRHHPPPWSKRHQALVQVWETPLACLKTYHHHHDCPLLMIMMMWQMKVTRKHFPFLLDQKSNWVISQLSLRLSPSLVSSSSLLTSSSSLTSPFSSKNNIHLQSISRFQESSIWLAGIRGFSALHLRNLPDDGNDDYDGDNLDDSDDDGGGDGLR